MNSNPEETESVATEASLGSKLGWLVLALAVFGSILIANHLRPELINKSALSALGYTVLQEKVPLSDLPDLRDPDGNRINVDAFKGQWSLIFFGFTFCPDVCPTTLAVLGRLARLMEEDAPRVFFITVDPERDIPENLRQYVGAFHPDFLAYRGSEEQTQIMATQLQTVFTRQDPSENYLVDHSSHIVAISPDAVIAGIFFVPHQEERMAKVLRLLR